MCERHAPPAPLLPLLGGTPAPTPVAAPMPLPSGMPTDKSPRAAAGSSRRRRLWELDASAHCPVIGTGLPLDLLRTLTERHWHGLAPADDYELHCVVVGECKRRTALAEAVQQALDRRAALELRQVAALKSPEALRDWWRAAADSPRLAAAFWAVISHARCTPRLEQQVLGDVHMRQHQLGTVQRTDAARLQALADENALLQRERAALQARHAQQVAELSLRAERLATTVMQLRGDLLGRDTERAALLERLHAAERDAPGLASRQALAAQNRELVERLQDLQRQLQRTRWQASRPVVPIQPWPAPPAANTGHAIADEPEAPAGPPDSAAQSAETAPSTGLDGQAVLCVGGRAGSVPVYRRLIEGAGARFLHHDGGEEVRFGQLEAQLAAADLVICQTGCVSHGAYWRVKDHCKRSGKRCLFVDTPSASMLARALRGAAAAADLAGADA